MKDNLTYIVVVLDRSGSMGSVQAATIEGINSFIEGQKTSPGQARMTLIQFDDAYEVNYVDRPITEVPSLNFDTYKPRGMTALLDAMGRSIDELGERLAALPESERPSKVVVVIQTDGQENHSTKFTHSEVSEKIKHQKEKYGWEFIFLGANQDAIATASTFNIANAVTYNANNVSTRKVFSGVSYLASAYRGGGTRGMSVPDSIANAVADDNMSL